MAMRTFFLAIVFAILVTPALAERCALLNTSDTILDIRGFAGSCPPDPVGKGWRWVAAPHAEKPTYDPGTQVLEGPTYTVERDGVTESYTVRDKTAEEIDSEKEARLNSLDVFILKHLCAHESRIRVLEGKSPVTEDQCRAAIKAGL